MARCKENKKPSHIGILHRINCAKNLPNSLLFRNWKIIPNWLLFAAVFGASEVAQCIITKATNSNRILKHARAHNWGVASSYQATEPKLRLQLLTSKEKSKLKFPALYFWNQLWLMTFMLWIAKKKLIGLLI